MSNGSTSDAHGADVAREDVVHAALVAGVLLRAAVELHNMHFFKYRGLKGYAVERQFSQFFKNSCFC